MQKNKKPTPEQIEELAIEKYGLSNMFGVYENYEELQKYADNYSGGEKAIAHMFIMLTHNTMAYMRAKRDLENE